VAAAACAVHGSRAVLVGGGGALVAQMRAALERCDPLHTSRTRLAHAQGGA
jgi:hypothetical protein